MEKYNFFKNFFKVSLKNIKDFILIELLGCLASLLIFIAIVEVQKDVKTDHNHVYDIKDQYIVYIVA
jgi:hypothetical protein